MRTKLHAVRPHKFTKVLLQGLDLRTQDILPVREHGIDVLHDPAVDQFLLVLQVNELHVSLPPLNWTKLRSLW
jgi:hypothetical protein